MLNIVTFARQRPRAFRPVIIHLWAHRQAWRCSPQCRRIQIDGREPMSIFCRLGTYIIFSVFVMKGSATHLAAQDLATGETPGNYRPLTNSQSSLLSTAAMTPLEAAGI